MKKLLFSLAAIATIVAGCAKENIEQETTPAKGLYTIKAIMADGTKTSIDDEGAMAWITGDQISVYDGAFETFTLKGEASGAEATFTGELTDPSAVALAVCPAGIGADVADEIIEFNLPSEYTYDGQSTHAFMIASGFSVNNKTAKIQFKHVGGLFKVTYNNVPEEAKTFCFEASKQIAGELYIEDYTVSEAAIAVDEASETGKSVTYAIDPTDDHSSMSFYVPVPVGTFDFNISLKDEGGNKIAKSSKTKKDFEIERGDYVAIPAINMPRKFVENFNSTSSNANHSKYGSGYSFTSSDVTKQFDYTWTAEGNVYLFVGGVRLGKASEAGTISSEGILEDVADDGIFTVKVYGAAWKTDAGKISVTYNEKTFDSAPANDAITNTGTTDSDVYNPDDFTESTDFVFMKSADSDEISVTTTSGRIFIDKIEIVEGGVLPEPFSISTESLSATWDATDATFEITAGNKVEWAVSTVEGLTFSKNGTDFSAELVGTGNATIKVAFSQNTAEQQIQKEILVNTEYPNVEGENSYTINFTQDGKPQREMDGDGSVEKPFSVVDALYKYGLLGENEETQEYYVKGTVRTVDGSLSSGALSYYIGTSEENEIQVYKGKDLGNINFSAATDLTEGDEVVVYGKIYNYVNSSKESTAEIKQGNYLYSINGKTSILTGIAVSGQKTSFAQNESWEFGGTVTASYRGKNAADVTSDATFKVNGSDPSTATIGKGFTVTVSYEEGIVKTTTYTYDVYDPDAVTLIKVESVNDFTPGMYVIMSYDQAYYVPNAAATNAGPTVTAVTKTNDEINITPAMVWNATAGTTANTWKFESFVNNNHFLTGSSSNGGVRVKTDPGTAGDWTMKQDATYGIIGTATGSGSRYLATYGTQDWRNYTSVSTTNKAANFFKLLNWTLPKHTLTITTPSNGTITAKVGEEPVSNGSEIEEGKTVTITAAPEDNYIFNGWTVEGATVEDATATTTTFIVGQSDITVSAAFKSADIEYDVNFATGITGGTVEVDKAKAKAGEEVTITATPTGTNVLRTLTVKGDTSGEEVTVTDKKFTMPAEAVTVNATFGAEVKEIIINKTSSGITTSYSDPEFKIEGVSFCASQWMISTDFIQAKSSQDPSLYNSTAIPGTIKKITVVTGTGKTARAVTVYGGTSSKPTYTITSPTAAMTMVFDFTGKTYNYFKLVTPSNACYFDNITIEYEPSGDVPSTTKLSTPTDLTWTEGTKTLSWTNTNTSNGTYGTNYKYQYRIGSDGSWTDATSATTAVLTITETKTVYVKAVAVNTTNYSDSDLTGGTSCTISSGGGTVTWTRVTTIAELTAGGTFIMGYEATAKSGVIVPLRSADCNATTSANGYFNTGTTAGSSTSGTIDMSKLTESADYEVYISSPASGKINIQMKDKDGSFYGATSDGTTKNSGRLYTSGNSAVTNLTPEFSSETNNQFKLTSDVTGGYKYLKYNTGSPRFAYYNSAGSNIVFYKKSN